MLKTPFKKFILDEKIIKATTTYEMDKGFLFYEQLFSA